MEVLPAVGEVQKKTVQDKRHAGVGRCKCAFWFAVAHDILGALILLTGVFAGFVIHDLFIYAGAVVIFLSLIWWVFWYSGNIEVPPEELEDDVGLVKLKNPGIRGVVRKVSDRFTSGIRNSFRRSGTRARHGEGPGAPTTPPDAGHVSTVSLSVINENTGALPPNEFVRETLVI